MWTLFLLAQVGGYYFDLGFRVIITFLLRKFVLVQHYDRRGQFEIALSKIDEAIEHTPTVIDLYSVKVCWSYELFSSFLSSPFVI